jgi:hypothetical protein
LLALSSLILSCELMSAPARKAEVQCLLLPQHI